MKNSILKFLELVQEDCLRHGVEIVFHPKSEIKLSKKIAVSGYWSDDDKKDKRDKELNQKNDKPLSEKLKFWGGSDKEKTNPEKQYRIKVISSDAGGSRVLIEYQDGKRNTSSTANRIITLLYDQLK